MNSDILGRFDPDPDVISSNIHNRDPDVVTDVDDFVFLP
jgi:hypothetical protein